jgi:hypothetical protein
LKILDLHHLPLYFYNDVLFAIIFIGMRIMLLPILMVFMYEGENVIFEQKIGTSFILFVSIFWSFQIILLILIKIKKNIQSKTGNEASGCLDPLIRLFELLVKDNKTKTKASFILAFPLIIMPLVYYHFVMETLFHNY